MATGPVHYGFCSFSKLAKGMTTAFFFVFSSQICFAFLLYRQPYFIESPFCQQYLFKSERCLATVKAPHFGFAWNYFGCQKIDLQTNWPYFV